jgi:transcriptional regulator with XRE-family HTH domain
MASDWLDVLRAECERGSQSQVARRLGVSVTMVSLVLKGTYNGNLRRIEVLVRGTLMGDELECPVLGRISVRRCLDEQARPFAVTNPQRVEVWRACRNGCPNRR